MRKVLLAATAIGALAVPAHADTILDPLQGVCSSGCAEINSNATTISSGQSLIDFGFKADPSTSMGDLTLVFLVPNIAADAGFVPHGQELVGPGIIGSITSDGVWSSGALDAFLGISASPNNPIDAFTTPDNLIVPGLASFNVFSVNAGVFTSGLTGESVDEFKMTDILPEGSAIVGFLNTGSGIFATANSGQLEVQAFSAVPGPIVGAGLPGLIAACSAMLGLNWKRRRRQGFVV